MQALEKSTGKTAKELFKMMEQGQLGREYILPFIKTMQELAEANGAYEKALKKLGTVESRMKASGAYAAARIAEAGYSEGLIHLYNTIIETLNENGVTLDELGKIYKRVFKGIAAVIKLLTPVVESAIRALGTLTDIFAWLAKNPIPATILGLGAIATGFGLAAKAAGGFGKAIMLALRAPMVIIGGLIAILDEVRAYFDPNVHGLLDNPNLSPEEQLRVHAQRNVMMGIGTQTDHEMVNRLGYKQETGLAGLIQQMNKFGGGVDPATGGGSGWFDRVRTLIPQLNSPLAGPSMTNWLSQAKDKIQKESAIVTINVYESGDVKKTQKAIEESLNTIYNLNRMSDF